MRNDNSAVGGGQAIGNQALEKGMRIRAGNLDLGEGGYVHDACGCANGADLAGNDLVQAAAFEAVDVPCRHTLDRKPAGALPSLDLLMHRPLVLENLMERRGLDRASRMSVEVRERDFVA